MVFAGSVHLAHALDALAGRERFAYGLLGRLDRPARRTFVLVVFVVVFVSDRTTTSFLWSSLLRRRLLFLARPRWLIVIVIRDRGTSSMDWRTSSRSLISNRLVLNLD